MFGFAKNHVKIQYEHIHVCPIHVTYNCLKKTTVTCYKVDSISQCLPATGKDDFSEA